MDHRFDQLMREVFPQGKLAEYGPLHAIVAKDGTDEREFVVVGYASPQVVDREKHLITREALAKDLPRFLAHPKYRNANIVHSNIQVAEVLPAWQDPATGEEYTTHVDEVGLFCVVRLRTDAARPAICQRVEEDILGGRLNSFSISGDAPFESRQYQCTEGVCFWVIDAIELYEITLCEEGVNPDAKFSVVSKARAIAANAHDLKMSALLKARAADRATHPTAELEYARIGPRVAKADAMRLSQFCADGSCPVNNTSMISDEWDEQTGGPVQPATADVSMDPDAVDQTTDPRGPDQAAQGQDWVQKAYARIRSGVVKADPRKEAQCMCEGCDAHRGPCQQRTWRALCGECSGAKAEGNGPTMVRDDVSSHPDFTNNPLSSQQSMADDGGEICAYCEQGRHGRCSRFCDCPCGPKVNNARNGIVLPENPDSNVKALGGGGSGSRTRKAAGHPGTVGSLGDCEDCGHEQGLHRDGRGQCRAHSGDPVHEDAGCRCEKFVPSVRHYRAAMGYPSTMRKTTPAERRDRGESGCPSCHIIGGHVTGCERCPRCHGAQHKEKCSECGLYGYSDDDDWGRSLPSFRKASEMDGFSADTDKPTGDPASTIGNDALALAVDRVRTTVALASTRITKRESREDAAKRVAAWRARQRGIGSPADQQDRRASDARGDAASKRARAEDREKHALQAREGKPPDDSTREGRQRPARQVANAVRGTGAVPVPKRPESQTEVNRRVHREDVAARKAGESGGRPVSLPRRGPHPNHR